MTSRMTSGLAAPILIWALGVSALPAPVAAATAIPQDRPSCRHDDLPCRIDRLERQLDYITDLLEERSDRPRRGGGARGQEMMVNQDCIFESCAAMAVRLCQSAGFQRGVAAELVQNGAWQRLVRAQCSD